MQTSLPSVDVVLLGIGHTNAHVLRMWRMQPLPNARLTCISNFPVATYSGMLPGVLAGQYPADRMEIDLVRLCASAGARLIVGQVQGLDLAERQVLVAEHSSIPFDALSIGIGSIPRPMTSDLAGGSLLLVKPMQTFLARLDSRLRQVQARRAGQPLRIAVVGGGAGGTEIIFCLPARVRQILGDVPVACTLVTAGQKAVGGASERTVKSICREFERRGVRIVAGKRVVEVTDDRIVFDSGEVQEADLVVWTTDAVAPPLLTQLNLPTDDRGFLLTRPTLQTTADQPIFAVGDSGTIADERLPKAGVYAVREGPLLWENIQRQLAGQPLTNYVPQRSFLKLLNTGDGRAIGEYHGLAFRGEWVWRLKNRIDGRFMDMYQNYTPPMPADSMDSTDSSERRMRCAGCGGKVSGSVLSRVLERLDVPSSPHVLLGLDQPDDAAIIRPPGGRPLTVTADFFAAPFDDPYLVGRIAALHAASDVFALGAKPFAALALVTIPVGPPRQQEQLLYELLAGSLVEFRQMGATLVGGHTIEGPQLTIGFTVLADQGDATPRTKARLRDGDRLILTKSLGSGILLAAHMRAACRAAWFEPLVQSMLRSNQLAAQLVDEFDIQGLTDITGFGLAGHLLEMLRASGLAAHLALERIPLLPGTADLIATGLESTLAPANRATGTELDVAESLRTTPQYAALFDPQTCGGLLLGVACDKTARLLQRLHELGHTDAAEVGYTQRWHDGQPRIQVRAN